MRSMIGFVAIPLLAACSHAGAVREVNAVVQDERARQAAVAAAEQGQGSKAALKAAADAASPSVAPPPS